MVTSYHCGALQCFCLSSSIWQKPLSKLEESRGYYVLEKNIWGSFWESAATHVSPFHFYNSGILANFSVVWLDFLVCWGVLCCVWFVFFLVVARLPFTSSFQLTVCHPAPLFLIVFVVCRWGGVGHANVLVSCAHVGCYAVHVSCWACTHGGCYAVHVSFWACRMLCNARVFLSLGTWWMLRSARVFRSLRTWWMLRSARVFLSLHTWWMLRSARVFLSLHTWWMLRNASVFLSLHTWWMLCSACVFLGLHTMVDATQCTCLFELAHMVDATQCTCLFELAHMVDATQCTCLSEPAHMVDATQCTCLFGPAHMVDATQWTCLSELAHIVDATQCTCLCEPAHMVDATQCTSFWACTHGGCYAVRLPTEFSTKDRNTLGVNARLAQLPVPLHQQETLEKHRGSPQRKVKIVADAPLCGRGMFSTCYESKAKHCGSSIPNVNSWKRTWILEIPW